MPSIAIPQDTSFTFDLLGRYGCNTLSEAKDSANPTKPGQEDARPFDHICIGGGSFGAILATRLFNLDRAHAHRILVLEAGPVVLPEHVQNLPPGFDPPLKDNAGTVWGQPWESPLGFPGLAFCVGGRSVFWGGWSPYFIASELQSPPWPAEVVTDLATNVLPAGNPTESYLDQAARVLGTNETNDFVAGPLHDALRDQLFGGLQARSVPASADTLTGNRGALSVVEDLEAPLAVASASQRPGFFASNKFSSVQLLFRALRVAQSEAEAAGPGGPTLSDVKKRLMLVDNCYVTRLERNGNRITRVFVRPAEYVCKDGTLVRQSAPEQEILVPAGGRVFLALGTIESTRLAKLAVPEKDRIGRNLMAHLRSNLTIRVPRTAFGPVLDPDQEPDPAKKQRLRELQISALFVKGIHTHTSDGTKGHYHIQITASGGGVLGMNSEAELFKKIPNIEDLDQFKTLTDQYVVITLRGIGEMVGDKTSASPASRVEVGAPDGNGVPRARVLLDTSAKDAELWTAMDAASDEIAAMFAAGGGVEYLSRPNDPTNAHWQATAPNAQLRHDPLSSTHHEGGTLWMGDLPGTSVTDSNGRIWEVDNLYAVGPALLPTLGSPNPMLSGVALARRIAERLPGYATMPPQVPALEAQFSYLFDGTEGTFQRWRKAGPGGFALENGLLIAQPVGDQTVFYYAAEAFGDFTLRLQFRLPGPVDQFGKAVGNSGVLLRFRQPHRQWADVNQLQPLAASNPAWVVSVTGFEVQIDEQGKDRYLEKHRTGAIYDIPTGQIINGQAEPKEQQYQPGLILMPGAWYEYEIAVVGDTYTVGLGQVQQNQPTTYQNISTFTKPVGKYVGRGLPSAPNNSSGYIGLQAHTGKVAFRNIRIRK